MVVEENPRWRSGCNLARKIKYMPSVPGTSPGSQQIHSRHQELLRSNTVNYVKQFISLLLDNEEANRRLLPRAS